MPPTYNESCHYILRTLRMFVSSYLQTSFPNEDHEVHSWKQTFREHVSGPTSLSCVEA